ncbi:unnamed protein product, partial [Owenia fusiformis]
CSRYEVNCELPGLSNCTEEALNGLCIIWSSDTSLILTDTRFTVPNTALTEYSSYLFTVTVSKEKRDPVSFSQMIIVVPAEKPNIHVLCLQNCKYKVTPNSKLSMAAHCTNCRRQSDLSFDWSIFSLDCDFTMDWATMSLTGQYNQAVSIRSNTLPEGCSFIIIVTGVKKIGYMDSGFATLEFTTNTPPIAPYRSCTVSPPIGVTLVDEFDIYCDNFQDNDDPLTYEFYFVTGSNSTGALLANTYKSELLGVQLGPGDSELNYTVEIHILATDYFQATTIEVVKLQVYPSHMKLIVHPGATNDTGEIMNMLENLTMTTTNQESKLDSMLGSGNIQAASQLVFTVSTILNMESKEKTTYANTTYNETIAKLEQRSLIRNSIVTSLANTGVDDLTVLKQKAWAMQSITVESEELAPTTKSTASHVFEDMSRTFMSKMEDEADATSEVIEVIASLLISGASNVMHASLETLQHTSDKYKSTKPQLKDTRTHDQVTSQVKEITYATMNVLKDVSDAVLKNKVVGEEPTVIQTETLSMTVMQSQPESLGDHDFSIGSTLDGATP